jgi:PAS domain S-box-containing protein
MVQAAVSRWKDRKDRARTKMTHQPRPWRSAISALFPVATAAVAAGIFIADIITPPGVAVAGLYVVVVLMATRFCRPRGVVLVAAGCMGLVLVAYCLSAETAINMAIRIPAIGATAFLAVERQRAEQALREQASLLDLTHDSIVARRFDDDLITYWNRGAEELYGWDRAEAVGRVGSELRKVAVPLPLDQIKAELLRVGRWEGELVNNKRDSTPVLVTSRWSLRRDQQGGPALIVVTSNDITERKHAEQALRESEEQWREVFEHNPVMYFMVSPTGTVLSANAFGAAQLGYTAAELIGQSVLNVFFEEDRKLVKNQLATCVAELGHPHSWEIRKNRKDGTVLWVRENGKAVQRSGSDAIVLIACEDITERRRGEQRVAAAYAVTRVLAEADSLAAAAPHVLRAMGENLEWEWGALWSVQREGIPLRCDCLWHAPDIATAEFDTVCRERIFAVEEGRLGQVWRSASPIWMVDATTEPEFLRAAAAAKAGLHGGVIFPILLDTETLGLTELFSCAARERDQEQLATLSAIGSQIGQFIKRKNAEVGLRASEERWRRLFETSSAGMALFWLDGVCTAANPALHRMLGLGEEEIVGHNVLELNHPDERAATAEALARYRAGRLTERNVEKKYVRKDGTPVWLNITNTLVPASETTPPFLQAVYVDVTAQLQAETALRASEERWRAIFDSAAVGIAAGDLSGGLFNVNPTFQRILGYTEEELRNLRDFEFTHEDDRAETRRLFARVVSGQQPSYRLEKRYRRKDRAIVWADVSASLVPATENTPSFLAVMAVDITERKLAEEALREAEERFRTLVQFSFDVYWESDAQHRFIRQEFAEGLADAPPPHSEIGKTRWEVPYLEPDAEAWRKHRETLDAHLPFRDFEHARPTPDGGKRYVSVSGLPVFDTTGRFIGYRGVGRHITDRKRAEAALRVSEERWRAMFEIAPVGITTIDFERRTYLTANASFQRMTGFTEAELRILTTLEITHEDDRAAMQERIDSGTVGNLQRKRYRRRDGEVVWADVTSFVIPATDSTPAFRGAVIVDITDRKRAEAALQQAQADLERLNRVMLLGEMTASIAHEVNQPIAATVTNAHAGLRWLSARPPDLEEARQALGRIVRDGSRAGEVIDRIRALVKKVPPRRDRLDINEAIREVIALTQTEVQQNRVRLQTWLAGDLPLVPADRVQLQQVIMNLIVNAVEAMSSVGDGSRELTIASGKDDANAVFVEVQDTGPGIDPADLDRLFQSFYTTKPDGIGMGLAISRSIIEAHGGRLSAASNQPHGALFCFTLPAEEKSSEGAPSHRADLTRSIVVRQEGG